MQGVRKHWFRWGRSRHFPSSFNNTYARIHSCTLMMSCAILSGLYCLRLPGRGLQMAGCLLLRPLLWGPHCVCVRCSLWMCTDANTQREREMFLFVFVCISAGQAMCVCSCLRMGLGLTRGNMNWGTSVTFLQSHHQSFLLTNETAARAPPGDSLGLGH